MATPPTLTAMTTNNDLAHDIVLTFTDDIAWRGAITDIKVNGRSCITNSYDVSTPSQITIQYRNFDISRDYSIVIYATGYDNATVTQTVTYADWEDLTFFEVEDSTVYPVSENDLAKWERMLSDGLDDIDNIHQWAKDKVRNDLEFNLDNFQNKVRKNQDNDYLNVVDYITNPRILKDAMIFYALHRLPMPQMMRETDLYESRQKIYENKYHEESKKFNRIKFDDSIRDDFDDSATYTMSLTR